MQSLKKERLSFQVTEAIKGIIEDEHLKPGDRLYSEKQLSERLEVSRSSIREALRMLEVSGLVKVYQGKGVFVDNGHTVRTWVVENAESLREHFEVRMLIEPHAAAVAARRAKQKDLRILRNLSDQFIEQVRATNVPLAVARDSAFHLAIAKSTGNRTLIVLMKTMEQSLNESWYASLHAPGRLVASITEHEILLQAIEDGNADAASQAMRQHLENALEAIQKHFGTL